MHLYDHFCGGKSETDRILQLLKKLDSNDVGYLTNTYSKISTSHELAITLAGHKNNLFEYLASRNLTDRKKKNRSQELKNAIANGQKEEILEKAMLCLYVVRCDFAHGSDSQIMKEPKLFLVCATLLAAFLMCLERKMI